MYTPGSEANMEKGTYSRTEEIGSELLMLALEPTQNIF